MQIRKRYISWAETTLQIRHLFFQESPALFRAESLVSWTQAGFWPHLLLSWVPKRRKQPNRGARSTFYKDSLLLFLLLLSNYVSCSGSEHSTIRDHYHLIHFYGQGVFHRPPTHLGCRSYSYKFLWELPISLLWCYIPPLPHRSCSLEFSFLFISLPSLQARFWHRHSDSHNPAHMQGTKNSLATINNKSINPRGSIELPRFYSHHHSPSPLSFLSKSKESWYCWKNRWMASVSRDIILVVFLWEIWGLKCKGAPLLGQGVAHGLFALKGIVRINQNETQVCILLGRG